MRYCGILTTVTAALVLALAVTSASADELGMSEDQFDIRWTSLEVVPTAGSIVRCPVTLLGTFHPGDVPKQGGLLIGHVDHAVTRGGSGAGECTGGFLTILRSSLPWSVTFASWEGSLPEISRVRLGLLGASLEFISSLGVDCLGFTNSTFPAMRDVTVSPSDQATESAFDPANDIPAPISDALCALYGVEFRVQGTGDIEDRRGGLLFIDLD